MNTHIKIKSKAFLSGNTSKLFFVSFFSFFFRYSLIAGNIYLFYFIIKSYLPLYYIFLPVITSILSLLFISGVRVGENFIYYIVSQGGKGRFMLLFKFLKPFNSFKTTLFYMKINFFKAIWLVYFALPSIFLGGAYYYLSKNSDIENTITIIVVAGFSLLISVSLVFYKAAVLRYKAAEYYFCLDSEKRINRAIKKSIQYTDENLTNGVIFEYSFLGWLLSCVFIVPVVYVVPFFKLSKALYTTEIAERKFITEPKHPAITFTAYKEVP